MQERQAGRERGASRWTRAGLSSSDRQARRGKQVAGQASVPPRRVQRPRHAGASSTRQPDGAGPLGCGPLHSATACRPNTAGPGAGSTRRVASISPAYLSCQLRLQTCSPAAHPACHWLNTLPHPSHPPLPVRARACPGCMERHPLPADRPRGGRARDEWLVALEINAPCNPPHTRAPVTPHPSRGREY